MTWIESHSTLRDHPKRKRLSRALGLDVHGTVGLLHCLWWWCMDYAPDGDLSEFSPDDIADGIEWAGDPGDLTAALEEVGFLDEEWHVHDWDEYGGKLHEKRTKDAERKRQSRAENKTSNGRPADVQRLSQVEDRTVEDSTGQREEETLVLVAPTQTVGQRATSLWKHWLRVWPDKSRMTFTHDRRRVVEARINEGIPDSVIRAAIERTQTDPWWNGSRDGEWKADIKTICGKGSTVENLAYDARQGMSPEEQRLVNLRKMRTRLGDDAVQAMCETDELWQEVCGA